MTDPVRGLRHIVDEVAVQEGAELVTLHPAYIYIPINDTQPS